jgi:DNA repair exonuclease SbcCD ATPase subunit
VTDGVTAAVDIAAPVTQNVTPGEKCPTCGRKVPLTGAQRMAAIRERERLKKEARAEVGE